MIPNLDEARRFLNLLDPGGEFHFQTQLEGSSQAKSQPRILFGTFEKCAAELVRLNNSGSAVWVQINKGTGRKSKDITSIRAYFIDRDLPSDEPLTTLTAPPDIVVETSPGKFHGYWLTDDAPLGEFKSRQQALAAHLGGDPAVCDLSRVMRLPGFVHRKGEPFVARIVHIREDL
jgi:hypothetical protein